MENTRTGPFDFSSVIVVVFACVCLRVCVWLQKGAHQRLICALVSLTFIYPCKYSATCDVYMDRRSAWNVLA